MLKDIFLVLIALFGIPAGLIISKYTKEEIRKGKTELKILAFVCMVIFLASFLMNNGSLIRVISGFVFLLTLTSLQKA